VGAVEVRTAPSTAPATHKLGEGHETDVNPGPGSAATVQAAASPVGSVEVNIADPAMPGIADPATPAHMVCDGHDTDEIKYGAPVGPAGSGCTLQDVPPPLGLVALNVCPALSVAMQRSAVGHEIDSNVL
jgi:hypothetical protein